MNDIRKLIIPSFAGLGEHEAYVGGSTAQFMDFSDKLYDRFPYRRSAAVLLLTFIVLMMFFQSVFLPLEGDPDEPRLDPRDLRRARPDLPARLGLEPVPVRRRWARSRVVTPAILFVILFSLSTDYEVFMLSRIKEYYNETGDNEESVATGLQHTAGVVTAAGLILIGVFGSFATAGIITIKEIGLGLAIGVLIDTVIVRTIMVPATMRLAGAHQLVDARLAQADRARAARGTGRRDPARAR